MRPAALPPCPPPPRDRGPGALRSQVIFIRPDTFVHDDRYPHGSAVTPALVAEAMRAGNTFLVHNLEIYWKPVGVLSEALSTFTNLYVQANLYYSPHGFAATVSPHQDAQSVFIVQLEGTKTWTLFAPRHRLALKKVRRPVSAAACALAAA